MTFPVDQARTVASRPSPLAPCHGCGGPLTDTYFTPAGDVVCRRCHYAGEQRAQDARATASLAADAPPGLAAEPVTETPGRAMRNGFLLLGLFVAGVPLTIVLLERIYLASGLVGLAAFGSFARALTLQKARRGPTTLIVAGIALTVIALLALVGVALF